MILEISGNKVSDDILRQINDYLVRNKNGDPILMSQSIGNKPINIGGKEALSGFGIDF